MNARFRVGLRLQRFEILASLAAGVVLAGSALLVWSKLTGLHVEGGCFPNSAGLVGVSPCAPGRDAALAAFNDINNSDAIAVMLAMAVLPLLVGMVLGVGVVAPEIEGGTAPSMWVLARSRARWLWGRMLPSLVAATAVLALLAVASQVLWLAREPYLPNPWLNFDDASLHGLILVAKGLAAYGVALAVGALLGRTLPAVILATAVIWIGLAGTGTVARSLWMGAEAPNHIVVADPNGDVLAFPGGYIRGGGWRTADGRVITDPSDPAASGIIPAGEQDPYAWLDAHLTRIYWGVPGDLFPAWDAAETAGYAVVGVLGVGAAFLILRGRRPYV
jgi:ABC-type transport system involved in multi-copper enzyme maturation permease subunit